MIGRPVNALLVPPQAERFSSLVGVDPDTLVVNVTGWNKLVLIGRDRVFLFPRNPLAIEWFERELAVYRAFAKRQLSMVPQLIDRWEDPDIYPAPFAAVTRLPGAVPTTPEDLVDQLGRAIASWHETSAPEAVVSARPPRHHGASHHQWLRRALDPASSSDAAEEAAQLLDRTDRRSEWAELLTRAAELRPVFVHGDIHEDQLLAVEQSLTGVIDWETARLDHPFWDFDLGEWGTGLWRRSRRHFSVLWSKTWESYARVRGLDADSRPLETAFRLRHALRLLNNPGDPIIIGTVDEQLNHS